MTKTKLALHLEQGECNGFMSAEWYVDDNLMLHLPQSKDKFLTIDLELVLPCQLKIVLFGKNLKTDTIVEDHKIIADKYISIVGAKLGNYPISQNMLYNGVIDFTPEIGPSKKTNYFHSNGVACINFLESDALKWHLKYNDFHQW
jgi:hypothetical protein